MNIIMLIFSEKPDGRTNLIADECVRGASDSGHKCKKYYISGTSIVGEIGGSDASEAFSRDFTTCGAIIFAVPRYRWGIFARVMGDLERHMRPLPRPAESQRTAMLVTSVRSAKETPRLHSNFTVKIASRFGWTDRGFVATPFNETPETRERDFLLAYTLGAQL